MKRRRADCGDGRHRQTRWWWWWWLLRTVHYHHQCLRSTEAMNSCLDSTLVAHHHHRWPPSWESWSRARCWRRASPRRWDYSSRGGDGRTESAGRESRGARSRARPTRTHCAEAWPWCWGGHRRGEQSQRGKITSRRRTWTREHSRAHNKS